MPGADAKCNELASAAFLPGIYKAGTASSDPPAARFFRSSGPYLLVDGTIIANDWDDLSDGSRRAPFIGNENVDPASAEVFDISIRPLP